MSNLAKFDNTIEDFSQEVNKLKEISAAYQKLNALTVTYANITKDINANSQELKAINNLLREGTDRIDQGITKLLAEAKKSQGDAAKLIEEKLDQLSKENKVFYKDLESTIKIKLDDSKSQIKQLIENERNRIKEIFELEFCKNTNELKKTIGEVNNEQTRKLLKNQQAIKYSVWIIGGIIILLFLANAFNVLHA